MQAALTAHRLVTLTGVGGVGKTRLATEVAARLADEFPDGVWFFELAAVADPAAVPDAVAAVLGITQQPGKSVSESVAAALEGRVRLLVFDNCEHVLDAVADLVEAILAQSATVRSGHQPRRNGGRRRAGVAGALAGCRAGSTLRQWSCSSNAPGASLRASRWTDEAAAVVEICRRLDGIPLAIELAASRMASMTASEVRDRLDHRFRLLVGSRRGLERHQTLRHAVAWSYDLLDDAEKALLERCSVFAGGFDLQSACAVAGSDDVDDYAILDLLDALVRKSLLVADRSSGRTRFSMLETIRQFAEEQLVARGAATEVRTAHARYFAGREADILALWDSPRQREAYDWFTAELANLRTAFRWAADHGDLDIAATIATYAAFLGFLVENYEPIAWAEELIEPARAVDHPRLAFLYVMASQCWIARTDRGGCRLQRRRRRRFSAVAATRCPTASRAGSAAAYTFIGQPERAVEWCRAQLARGRDTHTSTRACLVIALAVAGSADEAMAAANGLIDAAEATRNPYALSFALLAYGFAFRDADPDRAREAMRRGLVIAQDSGNRAIETHLAASLARLEANYGDPLAALEYFAVAIRNYHDSGNTANMRSALAALAAFLDRLGRYEAGGHHRRFRRQPPHRSVGSRDQHRDRPPPRCPRRPDLRIARPQGRDDDHRRHGDLRIRPNRPGPSRTERGLEIEHICDTHRSPCGAGDSARRDVSEVRLTAMRLNLSPLSSNETPAQIKTRVAEGPPSRHRLGPLDMPQTKLGGHRALVRHRRPRRDDGRARRVGDPSGDADLRRKCDTAAWVAA